MHKRDFSYELPKHLIAQHPAKERTASRLMVLDDGDVYHKTFKDLIGYIEPGDLLVFNDTKVIPARLFGKKQSGGKVEILVERIIDKNTILAQIRASKAIKLGGRILIGDEFELECIGRKGDFFELHCLNEQSIVDILDKNGHIPLPVYIDREDELEDKERYQTIYAKNKGAVAAPTAGLHFDQALLNALKEKGVDFAFVTLHVGAGTFQPVRVDNIEQHHMHAETIVVSDDVCEKVKNAKKNGRRVIAVGTTSVRCLETAMQAGEIRPYQGDTDIFIYPGYKFQCIDALVTNFHLPESTLLMLVSAFTSRESILQAYKSAVDNEYRFFSYGDAMFILKSLDQ